MRFHWFCVWEFIIHQFSQFCCDKKGAKIEYQITVLQMAIFICEWRTEKIMFDIASSERSLTSVASVPLLIENKLIFQKDDGATLTCKCCATTEYSKLYGNIGLAISLLWINVSQIRDLEAFLP